MIFTGLSLSNAFGQWVEFDLMYPKNGYSVRSIDGLEPPPAVLASSKRSGVPGEAYQGYTVGTRNVVITLGLGDSPFDGSYVAPSDLRRPLYDLFPEGSEVTLRFYFVNGDIVKLHGVLEKIESPIFVKESLAVISILCFDPRILSEFPINVSGRILEFNSQYPVDETVQSIASPPNSISYMSGRASPITFRATITDPANMQTLWFANRKEFSLEVCGVKTNEFSPAGSFQVGDILVIDGTPGDKRIDLWRGNIKYNMFPWRISNFTWPSVSIGQNDFYVFSDANSETGDFTIQYVVEYGGL